jgi:peptidyl-prolyl cis-trans isomerase C
MDNNVLARVGAREIRESDVTEIIRRFPRERQGYLSSEQGRKDVLDQIISFELIHNYALEEGLNNEVEYINQVENAKKELLTQFTINKVLSDISVSNDEAVDYYESNKGKFVQEESVRAKHILVDTIEEAENIVAEIKGGLSFEAAANQYSKCPSKAQGGDLGSFTRGRMVPEFEKAAFELPVGEVSAPIQTQFGYHIIKVEEKQQAAVKAINEVQDQITKELVQQKQNDKYMNLINDLKKKYPVEIK